MNKVVKLALVSLSVCVFGLSGCNTAKTKQLSADECESIAVENNWKYSTYNFLVFEIPDGLTKSESDTFNVNITNKESDSKVVKAIGVNSGVLHDSNGSADSFINITSDTLDTTLSTIKSSLGANKLTLKSETDNYYLYTSNTYVDSNFSSEYKSTKYVILCKNTSNYYWIDLSEVLTSAKSAGIKSSDVTMSDEDIQVFINAIRVIQ